MASPRMTIPTQRVLHVLLAEATGRADVERYGAEIGALAGLPSGTVHPILARLEGLAWVSSRWEDVDPRAEGRPVRRYYRLTPDGRERAQAALARAYQPARTALSAQPGWEMS